VAFATFTIPTSPVEITVGAGGAGGAPGGTTGVSGSSSSFGPYISATGGSAGGPGVGGTPGTGTISAPAIPGALKTTSINNVVSGSPSSSSASFNLLVGTLGRSPATPIGTNRPAVSYSPTSVTIAGGIGNGGAGPQGGAGATGGAVIVEFVG
jgi:hypothetical protein